MIRDTMNAVALGMIVGGMMHRAELAGSAISKILNPEEWKGIGWNQKVEDVDEAARALDAYCLDRLYPVDVWPVDVWDEYDWYLTLDKIAMELWRAPQDIWSSYRIHKCMVKL